MTIARARDLVYALYRRALHPEILPLARTEAVPGSVFRASLMLLEETGHAISFGVAPPEPRPESSESKPRTEPKPEARKSAPRAEPRAKVYPVLVEVVARNSLELPRAGRVDLRPLAKAGRDRVKTKLELLYECAYAIETCSAAEFLRRHEKILGAEPQGARLLLDRGHPENDGPNPFSLVDYETKERSLEAFVVHAFPRERAFVFVQSSFGVAP